MKHKKTLNKIIAMMLCLTIAITGICLGDTATANAATLEQFKPNTTITMKPGDTKRLLATGKDGSDYVPKYKWSSSDNTVVRVGTDFVDASVDFTQCVELAAAGTGTATITGNAKNGLSKVSMTVTVKTPKATAKQKKCKHKWKVTKKATCERVGVKTCKKCKLQKEIKKTAHKYVTTTIHTTESDGYYTVFLCNGCECENPLSDHEKFYDGQSWTIVSCDTACQFTVKVKYDKNGNVAPDSDYKSAQEAVHAIIAHHISTNMKHGSYTDWDEPINERRVRYTVKACKWCGKEKPGTASKPIPE